MIEAFNEKIEIISIYPFFEMGSNIFITHKTIKNIIIGLEEVQYWYLNPFILYRGVPGLNEHTLYSIWAKSLPVFVEDTDTSSEQAHQYTTDIANKAAKVVHQTSVWATETKLCQRSLRWWGRRTINVKEIYKQRVQKLSYICFNSS